MSQLCSCGQAGVKPVIEKLSAVVAGDLNKPGASVKLPRVTSESTILRVAVESRTRVPGSRCASLAP